MILLSSVSRSSEIAPIYTWSISNTPFSLISIFAVKVLANSFDNSELSYKVSLVIKDALSWALNYNLKKILLEKSLTTIALFKVITTLNVNVYLGLQRGVKVSLYFRILNISA